MIEREWLLGVITQAWRERPESQSGLAAAALLTDTLLVALGERESAIEVAAHEAHRELEELAHPPPHGEGPCPLCFIASGLDAALQENGSIAHTAQMGGREAMPSPTPVAHWGSPARAARRNAMLRLAEVFRQYRWASKKTLKELAAELGTNPSTLSRLEAGKGIDGETMAALLRWLLDPEETQEVTVTEKPWPPGASLSALTGRE